MYDGDTFTEANLTFRVDLRPDEHHGAPWDEEDGHGPVSDWRPKESKQPGERILSEDHSSCRFYDYREAVAIAKRDGWGLSDKDRTTLATRLGREPTKGDVAAEATERDFQRLYDWCHDEWSYIGVVVTLLDVEGNATPESQSLWGVESDGDYWEEVARELAQEIARYVAGREVLEYKQVVRVRFSV